MMESLVVNLRRTEVLEADGVEIAVCVTRTKPFEIGFFTHAGIDPAQKEYILLKS